MVIRYDGTDWDRYTSMRRRCETCGAEINSALIVELFPHKVQDCKGEPVCIIGRRIATAVLFDSIRHDDQFVGPQRVLNAAQLREIIPREELHSIEDVLRYAIEEHAKKFPQSEANEWLRKNFPRFAPPEKKPVVTAQGIRSMLTAKPTEARPYARGARKRYWEQVS